MVREDVDILPKGDGKKSVDAFVAITPEVPVLTEAEMKEMMENAQEIPIAYRTSFKDAIRLLLSAKQEGKNCFIDFNGERYYSVKINSMDDAYLQREGMTEAEWDAEELELDKKNAKKEQMSKTETAKEILARLNTVSRLFEESSPYVQPEKLVEWENDLKESIDGSLVSCIIELLKMIGDGKGRKEVNATFKNQDLSRRQHSIVREKVLYYSKKGEEAKENLI